MGDPAGEGPAISLPASFPFDTPEEALKNRKKKQHPRRETPQTLCQESIHMVRHGVEPILRFFFFFPPGRITQVPELVSSGTILLCCSDVSCLDWVFSGLHGNICTTGQKILKLPFSFAFGAASLFCNATGQKHEEI